MIKDNINTIVFLGLVASIPFLCSSSCAESNQSSHGSISTKASMATTLDLVGTNGTTVILKPATPQKAGKGLDFSKAKDSSLWINYTMTKGKKRSPSKNVYARIIKGSVPNGTLLEVKASKYKGNGKFS